MPCSRSLSAQRQILLVDDSPAQAELLAQALAQQAFAATMHIAASADSALRFLQRHPTSPDAVFPTLVLLDLKLIKTTGLDLLRQLRADPRFTCLPVVVFTTSDDPEDIRASYASGANGYVVKPTRFTDLVHLTECLCHYWLTWNRSIAGAQDEGL